LPARVTIRGYEGKPQFEYCATNTAVEMKVFLPENYRHPIATVLIFSQRHQIKRK